MGLGAGNDNQQVQQEQASAPTITQPASPMANTQHLPPHQSQAIAPPPLYSDSTFMLDPVLSKLLEQERDLISRLHFTREKTASIKAETEKLKREALSTKRSVEVQTSLEDHPQVLNEQLLEKETQINLLNQEKQNWLQEKEELMAKLRILEEKQKSFQQLSMQFSNLIMEHQEQEREHAEEQEEQGIDQDNDEHHEGDAKNNNHENERCSTSSITSKKSNGSSNAKKRSN